jgi:septum formation protein
MGNGKIKFVLASASPRRKELIGHLKVPFEIMTLNVPEESTSTNPINFCLDIAKVKGEAVYSKLRSEKSEALFVVSSDTIVCLGEKIYGKPKNRDEAHTYLMELSGKTHSVFTAVFVHYYNSGIEETFGFVEESKVTFNTITPAIMERYLDTGDSLDKAGAYGIQGPSLTFISRVEGDYANVVGFPLSRFVMEAEIHFKKWLPEEDLWLNLF